MLPLNRKLCLVEKCKNLIAKFLQPVIRVEKITLNEQSEMRSSWRMNAFSVYTPFCSWAILSLVALHCCNFFPPLFLIGTPFPTRL